MKHQLKLVFELVPLAKRGKLIKQFYLSFVTTFFDLLSVAILMPLLLVILDQNRIQAYFSDYLPASQAENFIIVLVLLVIGLFTLKSIVQLQIIKQFFNYIFNISTLLSTEIAQAYLVQNKKKNSSEKLSEFYHNIRQSCTDFASKILFSIFAFVSEFFVLIILFLISLYLFPLITIIIFSAGATFSYLIFRIKKRGIMNYNAQYIKFYHNHIDQAFNIFNGRDDIILNEAETDYINKFESSLEKMNIQMSMAHYWRYSNTKILELFSILFLVGVILFYVNFEQNYDPVLISFFGAISFKFLPSFIKLLNAYTEFNSYLHTLDIIKQAKSSSSLPKKPVVFKKKLELREISFEFNSKKPILNAINLNIETGLVVGINGNSGIGKTTFLKLIAGLYRPSSGSIFIDNQPCDLESTFSEFISFVPQNPYIFKGTILENITIKTTKTYDTDKIDELIKLFKLESFVNDSSDGLLRVLETDDTTMSTGQKQRLAFVRALYSNPKILLLDEATSHIEPELANEIFHYLKAMAKLNDIAIISVSHNKELETYYDEIFMLKYGGILTPSSIN